MILLYKNIANSIYDTININTGSAGIINTFAAFVDIDPATNAVTVMPPSTNSITTAASTNIVSAPADTLIRNVKQITISNSGGASNLISVTFNRAFDVVMARVNLAPNETLVMGENGNWSYYNAVGALQPATGGLVIDNYGISGSLAETIPRNITPSVNTAALTSGTLFMQAIYLKAGTIVSNISFCSATTAGATLTNQLFGLFDGNRNLLASTNNDGATAWAANTIKTLNIAAPYTIQTTGLYYLGIMVAATTVPTLAGGAALTNAALHGTAPILHGNSTTALTTALPATAAAITVGTTSVWGCVK